MLDFLMISTKVQKKDLIEIYPKFIIKNPSSDLMIRGGDFYAVWVEEKGLWSTSENDVCNLIDHALRQFYEERKDEYEQSGFKVKVSYMWDSDSGVIDRWHKYCQKQMRDSFHMLDEKLIFSNTKTVKEDYASKRLPYPIDDGKCDAWDRMMSVLYSEEERHKIEWAIGSIIDGASKELQKFMVFYGAAGTGKSTVLNVIQKLFEGYYSVFDAKSLGSSNAAFALEPFRTNPLVAIQHDGDLSRIEDNTRLNSLVSHEFMTVNEKYTKSYSNRFKCFLFMGTNKPVKITDAKSGLIRRLIDVSPTGNKLSPVEYKSIIKQIDFELGSIASHCKKVYTEDPDAYDNYIPINMLGASNDFYNFVIDSYRVFDRENETTLKAAYAMYDEYCKEARVAYPLNRRAFKEELKNYFTEYSERGVNKDGARIRCYYYGFKKDILEYDEQAPKEKPYRIELNYITSIFDAECADCPAQIANAEEKPSVKWANVTTKLSDIDTTKVHYVKPPENHIVIDFDIPDDNGNKSLERNIEAASKWPQTYAELSKSGAGIHLHYIYVGDVTKLSRIYDDHIEIKVFTGGSSLRRKLTRCNNLHIGIISSGLPLKGEKKVVNGEIIRSEKGLRKLIERNLNKEIHPGTKPSIDFIYKILDDAYKQGLKYDISDMYNSIMSFAAMSSHHSEYCMRIVDDMHFKSDEPSLPEQTDRKKIFYDIEVFKNLLLVCWKFEGEDQPVQRMFNPGPHDIEMLMKYDWIGFNCRRYDNHIMWARLMGYSNESLYDLSQKIINHGVGFFGEAYNLSYTDVYDFSSKKQSLKKFEIEYGIHHQELGLAWDEPAPEELWMKIAEYCDNDVIATETVFNKRRSDFIARQILADVAEMTVNDTTNSLTTRIIFGKERHPQSEFEYRFMGIEEPPFEPSSNEWFTQFDNDGKPVFPGYTFEGGKSIYRGEEVGEGGYVYAEPGIYYNVALLDIASMHPSSIVNENLFGDVYTGRFKEILDARLAIKHGDFDRARTMLGGKLVKYLDDEDSAKDLAQALKIAINSVYGLTSAKFENPFRDIRNKDNIVAKRGALFMVNLKHEVQERGFTVAHIKTDSIKIPDATPEIIQFVMDYGEQYGYTFEHEDTYDRICLVNDAVYIAKYKEPHKDKKTGKDIWWTATGTQFQVPYVFKKLFSHEEIGFKDLCETKSVTSTLYLDMNESLPDVSAYEKEYSKLESKYRKGQLSDTTWEKEAPKLVDEIAKGHKYIFVGKVGSFCPVKPGCGGGLLIREKNGKYYAATGTKGYRWLEAELVKDLGRESDIDEGYYISLVDDAVETISKYGDFEIFADHEFINKPE